MYPSGLFLPVQFMLALTVAADVIPALGFPIRFQTSAVRVIALHGNVSPVCIIRLLPMSYSQSPRQLPAPCIIDTGIIINKQDMGRLLAELGRVRYIHRLDGKLQSEGEGCVLEVFTDPQRSTLVANHALYLNVQSFDYLQLGQSPEKEAYFDLIQDNRQLRLIPLSNPLQEQSVQQLNADTLEEMVTQVLNAKWDVQIDDEGECPF